MKSIGRDPSELSIVNETSARPSGARPDVPAKMTSSIFPPRSDLAPCSPITQLIASTTLDLPEPFGPTTQVMPGSRRRVVDDAKDLKPLMVRLFKYTRKTYRVWQAGQSRDERLAKAILIISVPHLRHGSPSWP